MTTWAQAVDVVRRCVVHIETPSGFGTGFLYAYTEYGYPCIATALHVVSSADHWKQPIRLYNHDFSKEAFTQPQRADGKLQWMLFPHPDTDSGVLLFFEPLGLELPESLIPLRPVNQPLPIGSEVAWLGYPYIEPRTLCLFSGNISARRASGSYLIDGVAINGVSGGPVFHVGGSSIHPLIELIGVVSAYTPNRMGGETLPGLLIAQDVTHFHTVVKHVQDIDDSFKKQQQSNQPPAPLFKPPPDESKG